MLDKYKPYAPLVLRITIGLLFLWFGLNQLFQSSLWTIWLPQWTASLPISQVTLIVANGAFEVILAVFLLAGRFTQIVALLLSLQLFSISLAIGYNDVGVRDFALGLATFSLFLNGPDRWTWDMRSRS